ncbi:MAG: phosphatase PAP2 family protein [Betaproteobacteria bacterium]|nr:phosphatase PAP2 family protein [Betaproteobacteria bacterium]
MPSLHTMSRALAAFLLGALVCLSPARAQPQPASPLAPPTSAYSSAVAYEWFYLVSQLIQQTPGNSPPVAARTLGYLGLTLYESVVPGMPGHQSLAGQLNELSSLPWAQPDEPLHWPTVANASMAMMTRMMFSNASAENKGRIDLLERSLLRGRDRFHFFPRCQRGFDISNAATQEQRQFALYWADDPGKTPTPAGHWSYIANDLLRAQKADLGRAAATHALLNMAMSDAFVAGWAAKYRYNLIRPVTYIQLFIDSNWVTPLFTTPNFPEYPSGHSVQSSAAAGVLEQQFGKDLKFVDNTHNDRGWGPRTFASFSAAANEASLSRMYAGIHFRFGSEGGQSQGRCVAERVLALRLKP